MQSVPRYQLIHPAQAKEIGDEFERCVFLEDLERQDDAVPENFESGQPLFVL